MFPTTDSDTETVANATSTTGTYNIISDGNAIYKTPDFNFENKSIPLINGDATLIADYKNVRNWIVKFLLTPIDIYKIYEGTGFGTSIYKVKGYKNIDGMLYAQIRKEIEDGFLVNPNIKQVLDVVLTKNKDVLSSHVQ